MGPMDGRGGRWADVWAGGCAGGRAGGQMEAWLFKPIVPPNKKYA